ncbi:MAG: hydroxyethylthiazole kinase [Thermoplasmatales archaeon]|nr:hydroxyethylthiazole kinase [Thermoplasmatales archaeon]
MEPASAMMARVRERNPLVHQITNYVTVNLCANATICAGASPIMTDAPEDALDIARVSSALVLNIGTLNPGIIESMIKAGKVANGAGVPVVLDPVGAGATPYRTECSEKIIREVKVSVIKGNGGEIGTLAGMGGEMKGVDSESGGNVEAVRKLAKRTGAVVSMSGPTDYVSDGKTTYSIEGGHVWLSRVSGSGCALAAVTGAYVAANGVSAASAANACALFSVAAEIAAAESNGPGTFPAAFLDALHGMDGETLDEKARVTRL